MRRCLLRRPSSTKKRSGMSELIGQQIKVAFCKGTLDTCVVLDIDFRSHFVKLCYTDDPEAMFWKNMAEIDSFNIPYSE